MLHAQPVTSSRLCFITLCRHHVTSIDRSFFQSTFLFFSVRRQILFLVGLWQYPVIMLHSSFFRLLISVLRESNCQLDRNGSCGKMEWLAVIRPFHMCTFIVSGNPADQLFLERQWAKISWRHFQIDLRNSRIVLSKNYNVHGQN